MVNVSDRTLAETLHLLADAVRSRNKGELMAVSGRQVHAIPRRGDDDIIRPPVATGDK